MKCTLVAAVANVESRAVPSPLLRSRHRREAEHAAKVQRRITREVGNDIPVRAGSVAGDPAALRGIPVCGVRGGFGGAIAGTRPG